MESSSPPAVKAKRSFAEDSEVKIVVLGAGGVGGYFGGRLAAGGSDVTFVARGAHLAALRRSGLRITSPRGDAYIRDVRAVETVAEAGPADFVLVGVKLWDTEAAAANLKPVAHQDTAIVSLQNGVQKDDILRQYVAARAVAGGVCYIAASIAEPGVIRHTGTMQRLVFGEYDGTISARLEAFLVACRKAGIDAEISDSIERMIWEKFVFLVGLSGTTSLFRTTIGPIREDPERRAVLLDAMREVVAVGRAKRVDVAADYAENRLAFCDTLPAAMPSSMSVDLERGHRLELPWLSGAVVDLGARLNVTTPVNRRIVDALAPYMQGGNRSI
jgi:2-dehydropantoate 2-reductase